MAGSGAAASSRASRSPTRAIVSRKHAAPRGVRPSTSGSGAGGSVRSPPPPHAGAVGSPHHPPWRSSMDRTPEQGPDRSAEHRDADPALGTPDEPTFGLDTFGDVGTGPDGQPSTQAETLRQVVAEAQLADAVGLDFFGVGEHHRPDFAVSAPD